MTGGFSGTNISYGFPILNWPWKPIYPINCPRNWYTSRAKTTPSPTLKKNQIKQTHVITK